MTGGLRHPLRRTVRRRLVVALFAAVAVLAGLASPAAALAAQRASFTDIESDVMCVVCHEPLALAQSPEAFQERDYIRGLILKGESKQQIEHNLVEQYGSAVLAKPPAHGFNLSVYIIPPLVVIVGLITLIYTIPRWRRRARDAENTEAGNDDAPSALAPDDAQRLDADLARHL